MPARFAYLEVLGGPDAAVAIPTRRHVELRVTQRDGRSTIAALATSGAALDRTLLMLASLRFGDPEEVRPALAELQRGHVDATLVARARALELFRHLLAEARRRWAALEEAFPEAALGTVREAHPRARRMCGVAIEAGAPHAEPAYGASIEHDGQRACAPYVAPAMITPALFVTNPPPASSSSWLDWFTGCDVTGCDVGCLDLGDLPCDLDPGCL